MDYSNLQANRTIGGVGFLPFLQRVPFAKKKANDWDWLKHGIDYYDFAHRTDYQIKMRKYISNYKLLNGRGTMEDYMDSHTIQALLDEGLEVGSQKIKHYDILASICRGMHGDLIKRSFAPIAFDSSGYNATIRSEKESELIMQYLKVNFLQPMQQEIQMQWQQEHNVTDLFSMNPEEQQQFQSDVAQRVDARSPEDIKKFMQKDYKSATELEAQKLLNFYLRYLDIKFKRDECFFQLLATGKPIVYTGIKNGKPCYDLVNPVGFECEYGKTSFFIQDATVIRYETFRKYPEVFEHYGSNLELADIKKLELLYAGYGGNGIQREPDYTKVVTEIAARPELLPKDLNVRTAQGNSTWQQIYGNIAHTHRDSFNTVRDLHVLFKSLRKLKYIKRRDKKGDIQGYWVDESYKFNRANGDVMEAIKWVPQIMQGNKLGFANSQNAVYTNLGPLEYQNTSIDDPFIVKMPYIGFEYGRSLGNDEGIAPIDPGKPYQYKYNVAMAKIEEEEGHDIGNVLLMAHEALPEGWTLGKFLAVVKEAKIAPLNLNKIGMNPNIVNMFKTVDLSTVDKLAARVGYLDKLKSDAAYAMGYNPSRLGQISPYMTATNNQQNLIQSYSQTEGLYSTFNKVMEQSLTSMLKSAKICLKENKLLRTTILDNLTSAAIEIDWQCLAFSELEVFIANNGEDYDNMLTSKNESKTMIQNGLITYPEFIKLNFAKSGAEILGLAESAEKRRQEETAAQQQHEKELAQLQADANSQLEKDRQEFEREMMDIQMQAKILGITIDSNKFAKQFDIDENGVNDNIQTKQRELQFKYDELKVKAALEREKIKAMKNKPRASA